MIVERTQPSVLILETVKFMPGVNIITDEEVKLLNRSDAFKEKCGIGHLKIRTSVPAGAQKAAGQKPIEDIPKNAKAKIALIKECLNDEDLDRFEEDEERVSVLNAIEAQREALRDHRDEEDGPDED